MKSLILILIIFFTYQISFSQEIDSLFVSEISEKLIDQYIGNTYLNDNNIIQNGHCIYGKEEGFVLSCISSYWEKGWKTDLDNDGQEDILIRLSDEGLGGGGNAFGIFFKVVTLKKNHEIKDIYDIDGGGQGALALLSIDALKNGKIYATLEQNPRGYMFVGVTYENKQSTSLIFYLENNRIKEQSYTNYCSMAEMNKNIFKDVLDYNYYSHINRRSAFDSSYNEEHTEILVMNDDSFCNASLSGCENFDLIFNYTTITYNSVLRNDKQSIKNNWLTFFDFLIKNTRYKTLLTNFRLELNDLDYSKIKIDEMGRPLVYLKLKNEWEATILTSEFDLLNKKRKHVSLKISKIKKKEAIPYWEAMLRKTNK